MTDTRDELADVIAHHDAYHVNADGWVVCICGHICEGDDDDDSHARHVAEVLASGVLANLRADAWDEGWETRHEGGPATTGDNPYRQQAVS